MKDRLNGLSPEDKAKLKTIFSGEQFAEALCAAANESRDNNARRLFLKQAATVRDGLFSLRKDGLL